MFSQSRIDYELKAALGHTQAKEVVYELSIMCEEASQELREMSEKLVELLALITTSGIALRRLINNGDKEVSLEDMQDVNMLIGRKLSHILHQSFEMSEKDIAALVMVAIPNSQNELIDLLSN